MKKIALVTLLSTALTAGAVEVGVDASRDLKTQSSALRLTVGQNVGKVEVEGGLAVTRSGKQEDKLDVTAGYKLLDFYGVSVTPKVGIDYMSNKGAAPNGWALQGGAELGYSVMKNVKVVAEYVYQKGEQKTSAFDGSYVGAGVKVGF